jgi:hypothetical protein
MGRACRTHGRKDESIQESCAKARKKDTPRKDVGGRIILKSILEKYGRVAWTGFIWLRIGSTKELL